MAEDGTFPPLDVPKPLADGVWMVDSGPQRVLGPLLPGPHDGAAAGRWRRCGCTRRRGTRRRWQAPWRRSARCGTWSRPTPRIGCTSRLAEGLPRRQALGGAGRRGPRARARTCICAPPAPWPMRRRPIGKARSSTPCSAAPALIEIAFHHHASRTLVLTDGIQAMRPAPAAGVAAVRARLRLGSRRMAQHRAHPAGARTVAERRTAWRRSGCSAAAGARDLRPWRVLRHRRSRAAASAHWSGSCRTELRWPCNDRRGILGRGGSVPNVAHHPPQPEEPDPPARAPRRQGIHLFDEAGRAVDRRLGRRRGGLPRPRAPAGRSPRSRRSSTGWPTRIPRSSPARARSGWPTCWSAMRRAG